MIPYKPLQDREKVAARVIELASEQDDVDSEQDDVALSDSDPEHIEEPGDAYGEEPPAWAPQQPIKKKE